MDRRTFFTAAAAAPILPGLQIDTVLRPGGGGGPVVIGSANSVGSLDAVMSALHRGDDPAEAAVAGVSLVEDDPEDMTVGYGGLPNEDGVVQLDASVMQGRLHRAGSVAALERIRNPSQVALKVLQRTDHVLLVGAGALAFARAHGFSEQDLLTEKSRAAWLRWKRNLNPRDDWLDDDQRLDRDDQAIGDEAVPHTWGTVHCAALDAAGDLGACTSTSGLSWKLPGRVGDSPLVGAGLYVDNAVGAAGATGRGEAVIQSCGAFQVVQRMAEGDEPAEACRTVLRWITDHTRRADLLDDHGRPAFNVTFYALRRDGAWGSARMRGRGRFAVHDGSGARQVPCEHLYE